MNNYYIQYRYDTASDNSCGTVFCFKADSLVNALKQGWEKVASRGLVNARIVAMYGHNPEIYEIEGALDYYKKTQSIYLDVEIQNMI